MASEGEAVGVAIFRGHGGGAVDEEDGGFFAGGEVVLIGEDGLKEGEEEGDDGEGAEGENEPVLGLAQAGGFFEEPVEELGIGEVVFLRVSASKEMYKERHNAEREEPEPSGICEEELHGEG